MLRSLILLAAITLLLSCKKEESPKTASPETKAPAEVAKAPTQTEAPKSTEGALGDLKKAVSQGEAQVKEAAAGAKEAVKDLPDLGAATEPSFAIDKFKAIIASLDAEKLKELAGRLVAAIQSKDGVLKGLRDEISKLGVTDIAKAGELKKSLESSTSSVSGLKEKLKLVVDKLKEKGADVSQFTAFLPGA